MQKAKIIRLSILASIVGIALKLGGYVLLKGGRQSDEPPHNAVQPALANHQILRPKDPDSSKAQVLAYFSLFTVLTIAALVVFPLRATVAPPAPLGLNLTWRNPVDTANLSLEQLGHNKWELRLSVRFAPFPPSPNDGVPKTGRLFMPGNFTSDQCERNTNLSTHKVSCDIQESQNNLGTNGLTFWAPIEVSQRGNKVFAYRANFQGTFNSPSGTIGFSTNGREYRGTSPRLRNVDDRMGRDGFDFKYTLIDSSIPYSDIDWDNSPSVLSQNSGQREARWPRLRDVSTNDEYTLRTAIQGKNRLVVEADQRRTFIAGAIAGAAGSSLMSLTHQLADTYTRRRRSQRRT